MVTYLKEHAELIVAFLSIITFTYTVVRKFIYFPIKVVVNTLESHSEILKELQPNGGGSMKDKVTLMGSRVGEIDDSVNYIKILALSQLDLIDFPIWKSDSKGNTIFVNDEYKRLFEIDMDDSKGYKWTSLVHKNNLDSYLKEWDDSIKYRKPVTTTCKLITYRTKKEIDCIVSWKVVTDKYDNVVYIIGKMKPAA